MAKTKDGSRLISSKQDELIKLTNKIRGLFKAQVSPSEKQIFDKLRKNVEDLFKQFNDFDQKGVKDDIAEDDLGPEFVHRESISYQNAGEVEGDGLQERLGDIQNLQKDFHEVNNLFK